MTDTHGNEGEARGLYPGHLVPPPRRSRLSDGVMLKCPWDVRGRGVSGLEIRCPGLEVRLGVGEMQEGTPGKHEQLGPRAGEEITVREVRYTAPEAKETESLGDGSQQGHMLQKVPVM